MKLTVAFACNIPTSIMCRIFAKKGTFWFMIYIAKEYENMPEISDLCRETVTFNAKNVSVTSYT